MSLPPAPESWGLSQQLSYLIQVVEDLRKTVATKDQMDAVESRTREEIRRVERETRDETEKLHGRINGLKNDLEKQAERQERVEADRKKERSQRVFTVAMAFIGPFAATIISLALGGR